MAHTIRPLESSPARVLLLVPDRPTGRTYVRALQSATVAVECVRTVAELQERASRTDLPSPALVMVLPSVTQPIEPRIVAMLARQLSAANYADHQEDADRWRAHLQEAFRVYCSRRGLSPRQEHVLELYLSGSNDKEIAGLCQCSEATVYEHWRRMARKAAGANKGDVVTDFHRFLAGSGRSP